MLGVAHSLASKVGQPQWFPLPAPMVLCAERSIIEVVGAQVWLAAIASPWLAYRSRAAFLVVQSEVPETPQPWLSRLYARQASGPSGGGAQVIGSSIFVSSVFGSSVIDRTLFDEEER